MKNKKSGFKKDILDFEGKTILEITKIFNEINSRYIKNLNYLTQRLDFIVKEMNIIK